MKPTVNQNGHTFWHRRRDARDRRRRLAECKVPTLIMDPWYKLLKSCCDGGEGEGGWPWVRMESKKCLQLRTTWMCILSSNVAFLSLSFSLSLLLCQAFIGMFPHVPLSADCSSKASDLFTNQGLPACRAVEGERDSW